MEEKDISRFFENLEERLLGLGKDFLPHLQGKKAAILEIAGQDSIAAALCASESHDDLELFIPTVAYTGTEFGSPRVLEEKIYLLEEKLRGRAQVLPLVVMGSPAWWSAINGRYLSLLTRLFGNPFVCVGCHMYLHAVRIPLAKELDIDTVISGERESHSGMIKINQSPPALDAYSKLLWEFGINLLLPLRKKKDDAEISSLVGEWKEIQRQRSCVLSGNYRDLDGICSINGSGEALNAYLKEYLLPVTFKIVEGLLREGNSDYMKVTEDTLRKIMEARDER